MKNITTTLLAAAGIILASLLTFTQCENKNLTKALDNCSKESSSLYEAKTQAMEVNFDLNQKLSQLRKDTADLREEVEELSSTVESQKTRLISSFRTTTELRNTVSTLTDSVFHYKNEATADDLELEQLRDAFADVTVSADSLRDMIYNAYCNPTFISSYNDDWVSLSTTATKDSMQFDLRVADEITIVHEESKRFLRPNIHTISVYTASPYSTSQHLGSFVLDEKPKKLGLGFNISAAYNTQTQNIEPVFGAGLQYNILNIR